MVVAADNTAGWAESGEVVVALCLAGWAKEDNNIDMSLMKIDDNIVIFY